MDKNGELVNFWSVMSKHPTNHVRISFVANFSVNKSEKQGGTDTEWAKRSQ